MFWQQEEIGGRCSKDIGNEKMENSRVGKALNVVA